jgi:hypothetical protein
MRWAERVAYMVGYIIQNRILAAKTGRKIPFRIPRGRWDSGIKTLLKETGKA